MGQKENDQIYELLSTIIYSTVATVDPEGAPWAAPQFTWYDATTDTFYWCSSRESQHAKNILYNHKAYITVSDSMAPPGKGDGIYIQAEADEVTESGERNHAYMQLRQRHGEAPYWSLEDLQDLDSPVSLFKATAKKMWINAGTEQNGHFVLYRKEVKMALRR